MLGLSYFNVEREEGPSARMCDTDLPEQKRLPIRIMGVWLTWLPGIPYVLA